MHYFSFMLFNSCQCLDSIISYCVYYSCPIAFGGYWVPVVFVLMLYFASASWCGSDHKLQILGFEPIGVSYQQQGWARRILYLHVCICILFVFWDKPCILGSLSRFVLSYFRSYVLMTSKFWKGSFIIMMMIIIIVVVVFGRYILG